MTKQIVNRYDGTCRCGANVPAGQGFAQLPRPKHEGGRWTTVCARCASGETPTPAPATVPVAERPSFPPTPEQANAAALFAEGNTIALQAGAGTGKTSTLVLIGKGTTRTGAYTAFNKAIVRDAAAKMPPNVACNTMHRLAYMQVGYLYRGRKGARMTGDTLARILGIDPFYYEGFDDAGAPARKVLQPRKLAGYVMLGIRSFCQSADREPTTAHIPYIDGIDLPRADGRRTYANNDKVRAHLAGALAKAWADILDRQGVLPFTPDNFLKIWELGVHGKPVIPGEFILFDEAQDADPVMLSVVEQQGKQVVFVGDSQQQIYDWRGAVNALDNIDATATAYLTHSFRFGQGIADVANTVLEHLPEAKLRLTGRGPESTIGRHETPDCVLTRTNAGAIGVVLEAIESGRSVHLVGGGGEVRSFALAAKALMEGKGTDHHDLACFDSWGEVKRYVDNDPQGGDLALMVKLIEDHGIDTILEAVANDTPEQDADVVVSTAHKAKGREWDVVRLHSDFTTARTDPSELRLLYVAATRARKHLDYAGCPLALYIIEGDEDPEPTSPPPSQSRGPIALGPATSPAEAPTEPQEAPGPEPVAESTGPALVAFQGATAVEPEPGPTVAEAAERGMTVSRTQGAAKMWLGRCKGPGCKHTVKIVARMVTENHRLIGFFDAQGERISLPPCPEHGKRPWLEELQVSATVEGERCNASCWNARSNHCECPCLGTNHGSGHAPAPVHGACAECGDPIEFHQGTGWIHVAGSYDHGAVARPGLVAL